MRSNEENNVVQSAPQTTFAVPPAPPIDADALDAATGGMTPLHFLLASELLRLVTVQEVLGAACPETASGQVEGVDLYVISKERQQSSGGDGEGDWTSSVAWRDYVSGLCGGIDAEGAGVPVRRVLLVRRLRYSAPLQRVGLGRSHAAAVAHFLMQRHPQYQPSNEQEQQPRQGVSVAAVIEEGQEWSDCYRNVSAHQERGEGAGSQAVLPVFLRMQLLSALSGAAAREDSQGWGMLALSDAHPVPQTQHHQQQSSGACCNLAIGQLPMLPLRLLLQSSGSVNSVPPPHQLLRAYAVTQPFAARTLFGALLQQFTIQESVFMRLDEDRASALALSQWAADLGLNANDNLVANNTDRVFVLSPPALRDAASSMPEQDARPKSQSICHRQAAWKQVFYITLGKQYTERIDWDALIGTMEAMNPGYDIIVVNDDDAHRFLSWNFPEYMTLFYSIQVPQFRSDLLRYLLLYVYGGVYFDIDLKPLLSFDEILRLATERYCSIRKQSSTRPDTDDTTTVNDDAFCDDLPNMVGECTDSYLTEVFAKSTCELYEIYNGFIISTRARNPIFLRLVEKMLSYNFSISQDPIDGMYKLDHVPYGVNVKDLYSEVHALYGDAIHGGGGDINVAISAATATSEVPNSSKTARPRAIGADLLSSLQDGQYVDSDAVGAAFDADPCFTARYRGYTDLPCDFAAAAAAPGPAATADADGSDATADYHGVHRAYFMLEQRISRYEEIYVIKVDDKTPAVFSNGRRNWPPKVDHLEFRLEV